MTIEIVSKGMASLDHAPKRDVPFGKAADAPVLRHVYPPVRCFDLPAPIGSPEGNTMCRLRYIALLAGLFCPAASVHAGDVYVLGDSIGEGVAYAAHAKRLAHMSVHIRGSGPLDQIARTPSGATAILVLGSNDADSPTKDLDKHIDNIVQAAAKKNITLVWVGPHCVRRRWDARAQELDAYLSAALRARNVQYVSMRDPEFCSAHIYEGDGVHLTMRGYTIMWEKARAAAGLPEGTAPKAATLAAVEQSAEKPASEKTGPRKKHADKGDDSDKKKQRSNSSPERRKRERRFFDLFN
jgi:hypothetical protein